MHMKLISSTGAAQIAALFTCAVLAALAPSVNAVSVSLNPSSQTVHLGDPVYVSLEISGLTDNAAPSLGAFDISIQLDSSILSVDLVTFGNNLSLSAPGDNGWSFNPILNLFEVSWDDSSLLDSLQPGEFTLATIQLSAVGIGQSALDISLATFGDSAGDPLLIDQLQGGLVNVRPMQQVPESGPVSSLFFLVILSLFGLSARHVRLAC